MGWNCWRRRRKPKIKEISAPINNVPEYRGFSLEPAPSSDDHENVAINSEETYLVPKKKKLITFDQPLIVPKEDREGPKVETYDDLTLVRELYIIEATRKQASKTQYSAINPHHPKHRFVWTLDTLKTAQILCQLCHFPVSLNRKTVQCLDCHLICHTYCFNQDNSNPVSPNTNSLARSPTALPIKHGKSSESFHLQYITEKILAAVLPTTAQGNESLDKVENEKSSDRFEKDLLKMLEQKHAKNYQLFDLESCIATITLEKLCELCKRIDFWLGSGPEKVVVLQDRGDHQRLCTAIAAYLEYHKICGATSPARATSSQSLYTTRDSVRLQRSTSQKLTDLDIFSMEKFVGDVVGPLRKPSHKRYLKYFAGLLSGAIRVNSQPLFLDYVSMEYPPWLCYDDGGKSSSSSGEWRCFVKVYEGVTCVFTSDIYIVPIASQSFVLHCKNLRLRGDVTIRCYQMNELSRDLIFSLQFHTCAISSTSIGFAREDLDHACDDPRFPENHKITLHFNTSSSAGNRAAVLQSPMVRTEFPNEVARWDSFEQTALGEDSSKHLHGPVDGSLYATITKSAARLPSVILSPPPEFCSPSYLSGRGANRSASTQSLVLIDSDRHTLSSSGSDYAQIRNKCLTPTPYLAIAPENRFQRANSTPPHESENYPSGCFSRQTPRFSHRHHNSNSSVVSPVRHEPHQYIQEIRIVEESEPAKTDNTFKPNSNSFSNSSSATSRIKRESVQSPLTLSMDSGISSSGNTNRRVNQESSVSPTSFPSQVSPQEDKHRELDDILSDMLKNVRDIPDISRNRSASTGPPLPLQRQIRSSLSHQSVTAIPELNHSPYFGDRNSEAASTTSVKRSQSSSYNSSISNNNRDDTNSVISKSTNVSSQHRLSGSTYQHHLSNNNDQQFDTASTTTTLTPPPSESGRETPFSGLNFTTTTTTTTTIDRRRQQELYDNSNAMNLQRQQMYQNNGRGDHSQSAVSSSRQRRQTEELISATSDEESENIPYHAREHSRPFTYGVASGGPSSPSGTGMLKMQSGLSSPSLVRKQLGQTEHKKVPIRNEFEEMLRERRQKIDNEKYSISDSQKSPNKFSSSYKVSGSGDFDYNSKWNSSSPGSSNNNGYKYEPIKRSNTMDYGYSRTISNDGESWLHKQQQRLRAKKEQEDVASYRTTLGSSSRPNRLNASKRFDGYTSDTGFADEVEYRTIYSRTPPPVRATYSEQHQQPGRNYHTISSTTTTKTYNNQNSAKERPFVAVKRAHEQSKRGYDSDSSYMSPLNLLSSSPHGHIAQMSPLNNSSNINKSTSSKRTEITTQVDSSPAYLPNGVQSTTTTLSRNENLSSPRPNGHTKLSVENGPASPTDHLSTSSSSGICSSSSTSNSIHLKHAESILDALLESLSNSILMVNHQSLLPNGNGCHQLAEESMEPRQPTNKSIFTAPSSQYVMPSIEEGVNALLIDLNSNLLPYNGVPISDQVREESFSSYNEDFSPSIATSSRPETPAFPVTPRTPYHYGSVSPALPPKSPTLHRKDYSGHVHHTMNQNDSVSCYTSRRNSLTSNTNSEPQEVAAHLVKFVRDTSKYWYKPNITREEAVAVLRHASPGTFIVRDSKSFANAFGLVLKVAYPPANGVRAPPGDELVRHFLIEPTTRGVRLKGCANEPVFTSLSALVYQHSITPLALPCRLLIPEQDVQVVHWDQQYSPAQKQLLTHGAACNILYLCSIETESLTGPEAIRKAVSILFAKRPLPTPTQVHFKVSNQGITLTDNTRQLFFRKHYPSNSISFIGLDPDERRWSVPIQSGNIPVINNRVFAFVARRSTSSSDNICNIFCELEPTQPATAIVSFANNTILRTTSSAPTPATPPIL